MRGQLEGFVVEDRWKLNADSNGAERGGTTMRLNLKLGPIPDKNELSLQ